MKVTAFTGPDALDVWTPTVEVTSNSSEAIRREIESGEAQMERDRRKRDDR